MYSNYKAYYNFSKWKIIKIEQLRIKDIEMFTKGNKLL